MPLPECGLYLGSGIYNIRKHGLYLDPGAFSTWTPQDYSPEDYLDFIVKSLSTNKLILIAPCAILSSRKNNGGKHGNEKAENMGNNG